MFKVRHMDEVVERVLDLEHLPVICEALDVIPSIIGLDPYVVFYIR